MGVRVTKRYNADGSITKRTTISRKTIFGNRKSDVFVERIPAKKKKGCYIATSIYGSYDCPQVWALRRFRDQSLSTNIIGRVIIQAYYFISPPLVKYFGNTKLFKTELRMLLDRFVDRLTRKGFSKEPYSDT